MKRIVITGLGAVSPLGSTLQQTWENLLKGRSGIRQIQQFDASKLQTSIGGEVPQSEEKNGFSADAYLPPKEQKKIDKFILYAIAATKHALNHAAWIPSTEEEKYRTGVIIGSGIGGLPGIYNASITLHERGPRRVSPFFIPSTLINLAAGNVAIQYGFLGPNHANVTACAAGAHAIGDAARIIAMGDADVMIAGGAEAAICPIGVAGFAAARALSTRRQDTPEQASRPWDKTRDGFVMGEGAGIMVLEDYNHAKKRQATIYAELIGYGVSGDAHHITSPPENGHGACRAMKMAQQKAKIMPEDIDYINAHGTSTPVGDLAEIRAVKSFFKGKHQHLSMSSTKSAIGHLLGAAGGIEAVFTVMALQDQIAPPTLNLDDTEEEASDIDLVPHQAKSRKIKIAMSNAFGFGGTNASLIFKQFNA